MMRVDKRISGGGQLGGGCAAEMELAGGGELAAQRAGWEMLPPRDRVQKRSSADRVAGLSAQARLWLGPDMVHKGKKRAAAPVNSQKKKKKKGIDCWDMMDIIEDSNCGSAWLKCTSAAGSRVLS